MADISVVINGIKFKNPVFPAAGPNVRNAETMLAAIAGGAGGIVAKTISVLPADDPRPSIRRTVCKGLINCETWSEIPAEEFIGECLKVKNAGVPLIASIGYKPDEVAKLGTWLEKEIAPDAIEFSTHYVGKDIEPLLEIPRALRKSVTVPIWMKISPTTPDIEELARRASEIIDAFVAINSYGPVLDFDIENPIPRLGSQTGYGWMSGAPIQPIALRIVHQISSVQNKPVIGVGGIENGKDAIKFIMAGASAVQVCSAAIREGHEIYGKIAREMAEWLDSHNYKSLAEIKGLYNKKLLERKPFSKNPKMTVAPDKCVMCGACLSKCIQSALYMGEKHTEVTIETCIGCGFCSDFCPKGALELKERNGI